jgi:ribokinase
MPAKLAVIGSTNWDMAMSLPHIPAPKETVHGGRSYFSLGGKGANQALAASRAGGELLFITALGEDAIGEQVHGQLVSNGIDASGFITMPGVETGKAMIFVDAQGENCIGVASGANGLLDPSHLAPYQTQLALCSHVLVQFEIPMQTVMAAAQLNSQAGVTVLVNPAPAAEVTPELLTYTDILTPNEIELSQITGLPCNSDRELQQCAGRLFDQGLNALVVTLGGEGAFIATPEKTQRVSAFNVPVVDTTAAGDVFNGALMVALGEGASLADAAQFGCAAAALSVGVAGAEPSIPKRAQIETFLHTRR